MRTGSIGGMGMICPYCGQPMREDWGLRGIVPNYRREKGYRCTSGYDCDMVGYLLYEDTLNDPERLERLAENNRSSKFIKMVRRKRERETRRTLV